jgi:hypothetical protein
MDGVQFSVGVRSHRLMVDRRFLKPIARVRSSLGVPRRSTMDTALVYEAKYRGSIPLVGTPTMKGNYGLRQGS